MGFDSPEAATVKLQIILGRMLLHRLERIASCLRVICFLSLLLAVSVGHERVR